MVGKTTCLTLCLPQLDEIKFLSFYGYFFISLDVIKRSLMHFLKKIINIIFLIM